MNRLLKISSYKASKFAWQKGTRLNSGFKVLSTEEQPDFKIHLHHLVHEKSKAELFHLENSDSNNCFASIIQTLTDNNKGTPHILEHLACCGSELYPIRDPFFNMLKRSLNTYMNAWTGDDFTCYPFSTANSKDFQNLLKVYTDMVFRPKLDYYDFRQEGWRYEVNEAGKVQYKGIVLNEMKGAYQSPDRRLYFEIVNNLLAGTVYSYDTGGQPNEIVKLSYQELLDAHKKYYHPFNIKFFSYGDHNLNNTLSYLDDKYLSKVDNSHLGSQKTAFAEPRLKNQRSTITNKVNQNDIVLSYYLGNLPQMPREHIDVLSILNHLLFESNQATLYETLIESGVAQTFGNINGFTPSRLVLFNFGVKGVNPTIEHQYFEDLIKSALRKIRDEGVAKDRIQQAFHQFEVSLAIAKKNNGIKILEMLMTPINNGCEVREYLTYKTPLKNLKQKLLTDNSLMAQVIDKYLLNNAHFVTVKSVHSETTQLAGTVDSTPPEGLDVALIQKEQKQLKDRQQRKVDNSVLPILDISDIELNPKGYSINRHVLESIAKVSHVQIDSPAGHYSYIYRLKDLPDEVVSALQLFGYSVNKGISTSSKNYKELSKQLGLSSANFRIQIDHVQKTGQTLIVFYLTCLEQNQVKALSLLKQIVYDMQFEPTNMKNIFKSYNNDISFDIVNNPMDYARSVAFAKINPFEKMKDRLAAAKFCYQLASQYVEAQNDLPLFQTIKKHIRSVQPEFAVYTDRKFDTSSDAAKVLAQIKPLASSPKIQEKSTFNPEYTSTTYSHPNYDVNCCVQAFQGPSNFTPEAANLSLFLQILQHKYLHKEIREKGGAYGSGAKLGPSGCVSLSSYLDPRCAETFKVFTDSVTDLIQNGLTLITPQQFKEAKLAFFSRVDHPVVEHEKGLLEIMSGVTQQQIQEYRKAALDSQVSDILQAGKKYLQNKNSAKVVFGKDVPDEFSSQSVKFFSDESSSEQ